MVNHERIISIDGDNIRLGQFIKLANLVATGGEAKSVIAEGLISVNGETATQRGLTLHPGDTVTLDGGEAVVVGAPGEADDEEDYFDEATANDDFDPEKWRNL